MLGGRVVRMAAASLCLFVVGKLPPSELKFKQECLETLCRTAREFLVLIFIKPNLVLSHFRWLDLGSKNQSCSEWPETLFCFGIF